MFKLCDRCKEEGYSLPAKCCGATDVSESTETAGSKAIAYRRIEMVAMAIVNHTAEEMGVNVDTRQRNNDHCFDYAMTKIRELL